MNWNPFDPALFGRAGVLAAWKKYGETLSWGKGQCLALLDDGFDLTRPEWQVRLPWGPKVVARHNTIDGNDDCTPGPLGGHGTTVGFDSSYYYEGKKGVAFNNQVALVRCVQRCHPTSPEDTPTMVRALHWVLENHEKCNITAVNLAPLDDVSHASLVKSDLDAPLKDLREAGVWVSAPCGNMGFTDGITWPACAPDCFAIGATNVTTGRPHLNRFSNTNILVAAEATSSSNACIAGATLVLREAIEQRNYDWRNDASTLPEAMMAIFRRSGGEVTDPETGRTYREFNLLAALDTVLD